MKSHIPAQGEHGKGWLPVLIENESIKSIGYARGAQATFDWYNNKLQILVYSGIEDEPAVTVRLNRGGGIEEIAYGEHVSQKIRAESGPEVSAWLQDRDFPRKDGSPVSPKPTTLAPAKRQFTDDTEAWGELEKLGYVVSRAGMISHPNPDDVVTDEAAAAIQYLVDEWDYGFIKTT